MNSAHNLGPQSGGATTSFPTAASIKVPGLGSEAPYGLCQARGCVGLAGLPLRGIPLCSFHFHNADFAGGSGTIETSHSSGPLSPSKLRAGAGTPWRRAS